MKPSLCLNECTCCGTVQQIDSVVHVLIETARHEDVWGSGGIEPRIFNLSTDRGER